MKKHYHSQVKLRQNTCKMSLQLSHTAQKMKFSIKDFFSKCD